MSEDFIDIKIYSFDVFIIERTVCAIMHKIECSDSKKIIGPIPIPTRRKYFTVNRSPHVNKNSREHFGLFSHIRLIRISGFSKSLINALSEVNLPSGVEVRIKVIN